MSSFPASAKYLVRLLLAITIIFICIILETLLVPLFFSILLAYLLYPSANKLESFGIPRIIINLFLIISTLLLIVGFFYLAGHLIANLAEEFSDVREQFEENLRYFRDAINDALGISEDQIEDTVTDIEGNSEYTVRFFTATTNTIVAFGLIPVYTFLLLFYRNKFRVFLELVTPKNSKEITNNIVDQIAKIVPKYLKGLIVVVIVLMFINSGAFWLIGLDYPILLGVIAALFNLIPYLGTVIGYAVVLLIVLATQEPTLAFGVILLFFPVQFFENNILTPNITGSYVQINPLIIILSLLAGALMWGLPGMLLVIPYLAMIKIICDNIDNLKPVAYLLSTRGTEAYLPSLSGIKKWTKSKFG
ncbi:AI-2E family transporter [soil metagenome]